MLSWFKNISKNKFIIFSLLIDLLIIPFIFVFMMTVSYEFNYDRFVYYLYKSKKDYLLLLVFLLILLTNYFLDMLFFLFSLMLFDIFGFSSSIYI